MDFSEASAVALRNAAKAVEVFAEVEGWRNIAADDVSDPGVRLEWKWGSACKGYDDVRREVQEEVNKGLSALILRAVDRIESRAQAQFNEAFK